MEFDEIYKKFAGELLGVKSEHSNVPGLVALYAVKEKCMRPIGRRAELIGFGIASDFPSEPQRIQVEKIALNEDEEPVITGRMQKLSPIACNGKGVEAVTAEILVSEVFGHPLPVAVGMVPAMF